MKYVLSILLILFLLYLFIPSKEDNIEFVFNEEKDFSYDFITVNTPGLTTKNFYKYFDNTNNMMAIIPKINPLYKDKLKLIRYNCNKNCSIEKLLIYYKYVLKNNNYIKDSINIDYYGMSIEKIVFYINDEELNNILKKCNICYI